MLSAIKDLCFNRNKFSKSLFTEELFQKALLILGAITSQLTKAGDQKMASEIIENIHQKLGLHGNNFILQYFTII